MAAAKAIALFQYFLYPIHTGNDFPGVGNFRIHRNTSYMLHYRSMFLREAEPGIRDKALSVRLCPPHLPDLETTCNMHWKKSFHPDNRSDNLQGQTGSFSYSPALRREQRLPGESPLLPEKQKAPALFPATQALYFRIPASSCGESFSGCNPDIHTIPQSPLL